jgi:AcrR family transcriptional regulator
MSETRQRILDTARSLFNDRGLSRVGVRDIARALSMSPGNLAYHFATRDDLVEALVLELYELDRRTIFTGLPERLTPAVLYESAVAVMRNLLDYRFILLSYVDAVRSSRRLLAMETTLRRRRRQRHDALVDGLIRSGCLDRRLVLPQTDYLFEQGEMISSGWLKSAALQGWTDEDAVVLRYAKVGMALLLPYATPSGARQIRRILHGARDPARARASAQAAGGER